MDRRFLVILTVLCTAVATYTAADDYVDDAYYWYASTPKNTDAKQKDKTAQQEVKTKRQKTEVTPQAPKKTEQQNQGVSIIQANDTVVKAVIRRKSSK